MNINSVLFILIVICLTQVGCSVSSVGHNSAEPNFPTEVVVPVAPIGNATPAEPVIVSEPINVLPETHPDEHQTTEPTAMQPIVESDLAPDSYIKETPTNPAMIVVEGTPITSVEVEPATAEPSVAPEENENPVLAEVETEPVSTPQEMIDAVESIDIQAPTEIAETESETEDRGPASDYAEEDQDLDQEPESPEVSDSEEDDVDFVVEGKCHGKKKATVLYNRKGKKKKGLTAMCKKDRFKIKIREKKKHLKSLKVQTLLQ